jgi:hypothetical protein
LALTTLGGINTAVAQPEIDRVRAKADPLVDDFGNRFNHVPFQVKVDTTNPSLPIDVRITTEFGEVSQVQVDIQILLAVQRFDIGVAKRFRGVFRHILDDAAVGVHLPPVRRA